MSSLALGGILGIVTLLVMVTGIPIAFSLGLVSVAAIYILLDPFQFNMLGKFVFSSLNDFALLSIPLFIFMGAVFAGSKASNDLFDTGEKWLNRVPGGLGISSVVSSSIFAALTGSSSATAAAIGKVAIPEMRKRGYSNAVATGAIVAGGTLGILIPPSVTLILYGVAVEQSIGKLFMGGIIPGIIMTILFALWIPIAIRLEKRRNVTGRAQDITATFQRFTWRDRFLSLIQVIPFMLLILAILGVLYLGIATPSEAAAVGAILALLLVAVIYRSMTWKKLMNILLETTKESTMILMITAFSALVGVMMSYLSIPQNLAEMIAGLHMNKWIIMLFINLFLLVLGCFLPPAAIILMTAPILYPIIVSLQFDPIWFGVIMTINMEMGLITPPVGLNLYVVKGIAPDIPLTDILRGATPYVFIIALAIVLFCFFPQLITWLPDVLIPS
jgi:tripartite ATP-independent transporter DctM subunit